MDLVKIPFSQYLNGYNTTYHRDFRAASENLAFVPSDIQVGSPRESEYEIDRNGHTEKVPVYELQSFDFDRWGLLNSRYVYNGRHAAYMQYIALDGNSVKLDAADMDALRRGIACAVDYEQHDLFLDRDRYIDVAESGHDLEAGVFPVKLDGSAMPKVSRVEAFLIMRIWQNCWERMSAIMNGTGISMSHNVEIYIARKQEDPLRACVDLFQNWLARILPPQVMSMISVAVSGTFHEQKWEDSACKILINGDAALEGDRSYMFCVDNLVNGVPTSLAAPRGWENSLEDWERDIVNCIEAGNLPAYFAFIDKAMREKRCTSADEQYTGIHNVIVRADFTLMAICTQVERYLRLSDSEFSYDYFAYINRGIGRLAQTLQRGYHFDTADVHYLIREAEHLLADRAAGLGMPLNQYEYEDFAFIYSEVEHTDEALAGKLLNILGGQCRFADTGELIGKAEGIADMPNIYIKVLGNEIMTDLDGTSLDREEYMRWVRLYDEINSMGNSDDLLDKLTVELAKCLRFDDDGVSPLVIAEENNLNNVVTGQVRGLIADYADRCMGRLSFAEYNQVLELFTDYRYSARLNDQGNQKARALLTAQYTFADNPALVADVLADRELVELWNICVSAECAGLRSRGHALEDSDFELWSGRLRYVAIDEEVSESIVRLLTDMTPREQAAAYIVKASEKELIVLEEQLVLRQIGIVASAEYLLSAEDFKWWIGRYEDSQNNAKPFESNIFEMLEKVRLKEKDADILEIVRESKRWKLLSSLVCREIPGVKVLNTERYDKWIVIYNDLQNAEADVDREAIRACEELLSQRINYDTIKRLETIRDQGVLFWNALDGLAENQIQSTGIMREQEFITWMRYLKEAENEGNPVAGKIRSLLNGQCRLRGEGEAGVRMAYDVAVAEKCNDPQLLIELIRTEFAGTVGESGVRSMAHVERWLGMYNYLNSQGDDFAAAVADKLCERCRIEGTYVLDVARRNNVQELEQKLIRAEYKDLPENNSIRDLDALRRWMSHYAAVRTIGDDEMEKAIAEKVSQRPILDGQYVLQTVLDCGGSELEEAMLECEKNAARAYNAEEYKFRLDRYFSNHYGELYLELLTAKGNRQDNLDRFIAYLRETTLGSDSVRTGGDLLEKLTKDTRQFSIDTINAFREISNIEAVKGILRANQPVLEQMLTQAVQNGMNMDDMQCLYVLRDSSSERMQNIDNRAADEFADALVSCDAGYNIANFNSYFKNGVDETVAARVLDGVTTRTGTIKVAAGALANASAMLNEVHMPTGYAVDIMGQLLAKTAGQIDINVLLDFVVNRDMPYREQMMKIIAGWMRTAEEQPSGNLDAIMAFTGKLHGEALDNVSPVLFDGVRVYLDNGNGCENAEYRTYERVTQLWGERSDITGVIYPMLNNCISLTDVRTEYVREQLEKGPLSFDDKYGKLIETRNAIETGSLGDILRASESADELIAATEKLPWLDDDGFAAIAAYDDISEALALITEKEITRKIEDQRVNGSKTPVLNGLCDMVLKVNELDTMHSLRENISEKLNDSITRRVDTAFDECVRIFDRQNVGETTNALNRLKSLLTRIGADATKPLSPGTIEWCERYVNAVVHGTQDTRIVTEIHENRCDFLALRSFVSRVYDSFISREPFSEEQIVVLLASAKVMDMHNVWTRYITMAARMPQDRDNIWSSGMEVSVVMHVLYAYNKLDNIGDNVVSADSLADYCASDANFAVQQKKQKNKELKMILERGKGESGSKGGLFGLFRKK